MTLLALALGVYLWMFVHVSIHEGAHLVAARAVGFAPFAFTVGRGPRLFKRRIGDVQVRYHLFPLPGVVQARFVADGLVWKGALFSVAGLAADTVLLALLLWLAGFQVGGAPQVTDAAPGKAFFAILATYQALMIAVNLVPANVVVSGTTMPNDGKQLLNYLSGATTRSLQEYEKALAKYDPSFRLADSWMLSGKLSSLRLLSAAEQDMSAGRYAAAAQKYLRAIAVCGMHTAEKAALLDRIACIPLYHGDKSLLADAEAWARRASALSPGCATLRGTLGGILVERGECADGLALLMPLTSEENTPTDRTLAACFLAKAFCCLGDAAQAARWLEAARSAGGFPAVVSRIEAEVRRSCGAPA